jgi:hypothetical protein
MSLDPKAFQKLPSKWSKKQQVDFENLKEGKTTKQKGRLLSKNQEMIPKATWMSFNFEKKSTCQTSSLKACYKEKKVKEVEPKGMLGILMPLGGQQNSTRGTNPRDNSSETQAKHLQG